MESEKRNRSDEPQAITLEEFMVILRKRVDDWEKYLREQDKLHPEHEMLTPRWKGDWFEYFAIWESPDDAG